MKTVTDFRKTVETGVDPRLWVVLYVNYGNWVCWFRSIFVVCPRLEDVQENVWSWKVFKN